MHHQKRLEEGEGGETCHDIRHPMKPKNLDNTKSNSSLLFEWMTIDSLTNYKLKCYKTTVLFCF